MGYSVFQMGYFQTKDDTGFNVMELAQGTLESLFNFDIMKRIIVACLALVLISTILESCASGRSGCPTTNPNYFRGRR